MSYIENIYICLVAPLLIAVLCTKGRGRRSLTFIVCGMTSCILSSYISTFIAAANNAGILTASMTIAPLVEEVLKILPALFFLLVFEPDNRSITDCVIMISIGFSTFENVCYMTQSGTSRLLHLLIRGFGTGAMHVICGLMVAYGMVYLWDKLWLRVAGIIGLVSAAITYHGIYNILVSQNGAVALIGYIIPVFTAVIIEIIKRSSSTAQKDEAP